MQLTRTDGSLAVVGFLIDVGYPNQTGAAGALLRSVFSHIDEISEPGTATETGALEFCALEEHVAASEVFTYSGSLTTPPCSEGVSWFVVREPLYVDLDVYQGVKEVVRFNARYTQNQPGGVNLLENAAVVLGES